MVKCGLHYANMICQITQANLVQVHEIGAKLYKDLKIAIQTLQIVFLCDENNIPHLIYFLIPFMVKVKHS